MSDLRITINLIEADQKVPYPSDEHLRIFLAIALVRADLTVNTNAIEIESVEP